MPCLSGEAVDYLAAGRWFIFGFAIVELANHSFNGDGSTDNDIWHCKDFETRHYPYQRENYYRQEQGQEIIEVLEHKSLLNLMSFSKSP